MSGVELILAFLAVVSWAAPSIASCSRSSSDQVVVIGRRIVSVRLRASAYAHGLALALPEKAWPGTPTAGSATCAERQLVGTSRALPADEVTGEHRRQVAEDAESVQ